MKLPLRKWQRPLKTKCLRYKDNDNKTKKNNKKAYQNALERLELIFDSKKGSANGDELEILGMLLEKYEEEHFPIGFPDPNGSHKI